MQTIINEGEGPALSFEQEVQREMQQLRELAQRPINRFLGGVAGFIDRSTRAAIGAALGIGAAVFILPAIPNIGHTPLASLTLSDLAKVLFYGLLWVLAIYIASQIAFSKANLEESPEELRKRAFCIVEDRRPPVFFKVVTPRNLAAAKKLSASSIQRVHAKLFEIAQQNGGTVSNADVRKVCLAEGKLDSYVWLVERGSVLIPAGSDK